MKDILYKVFALFFVLTMIASCKSSNEVVSNNLIQKRKYMKGYYVNNHKMARLKPEALVEKESVDIVSEDVLKSNQSISSPDNSNSFEKTGDSKFENIPSSIDNELKDEKIAIKLKVIMSESKKQANAKVEKLNQKILKKLSKNDFVLSEDELVIKKTEPLGIVSLISGVVGLLIIPLLFGTTAIIFSAVSISKINKNPQKYKGMGWAIAGLILGLINVVWGIAVLVA
jgi:hypothetical protein